MCTNIRYIPTRQRFFSPYYSERLLQPIQCGYCSECLSAARSEWSFRIYHEWLATVNSSSNAFVFFDTLTYDDAHLPHVSHFVDGVPESLDFSCFSRADVALFMSRLRRKIELKTGSTRGIKYFLCSEYGSDRLYRDRFGRVRQATVRPHYHVLFFVTASVTPNQFKAMIRHCWDFGQSDALKMYGEHANVFSSKVNSSLKSQLAVSHYVGKYVQKCSAFLPYFNDRVNALFNEFFDRGSFERVFVGVDVDGNNLYDFRSHGSDISSFRDFKAKLKRECCTFKLVSRGFGESFLSEFDILSYIDNQFVTLRDVNNVVKKVRLPYYYYRKVFFDLIKIDGFKVFNLNRLGKLNKVKSDILSVARLSDKYRNAAILFNLPDVDFDSLSRYTLFKRFRSAGILSPASITDRLAMPDVVYLYTSPTDKYLFGDYYATTEFNGMQGVYYSSKLDFAIPFRNWFVSRIQPPDSEFEKWLTLYDRCISVRGIGRDKANSISLDVQLTLDL